MSTYTFNVHTGDRTWPFFVDGDGIEHHVIRTDICRYLSGDAVVRKGNWEGREGYFYAGYRILTEAQIRTLKEDSRRWLQERAEYWNRRREPGPEYSRSDTFQRSIHMQRHPQEALPPSNPVPDIPRPPVNQTTTDPPFEPYTQPVPPQSQEAAPPAMPLDPPYNPQRYVYDQNGRPYYDLIRGEYLYQSNESIPRHVPPTEPGVRPPPTTQPHTADSGYWNYRDGQSSTWYSAGRGTN